MEHEAIHRKRQIIGTAVRIGATAIMIGAFVISSALAEDQKDEPIRDDQRITDTVGVGRFDSTAETIARQEEPVAPETEAQTEAETEPETIPQTEAKAEPKRVKYWANVPLDRDIQAHVFDLCEQRGIDPAIVYAMIWRESRYEADTIGDNGNAFGLLQIQPRWHGERMARLGCTDLLNPLQNVTVGIDYLAELIERGNGLEWAITAYNRGAVGANKCGGVSEYAKEVMAEAERMMADERKGYVQQ